MLTEPVDSHKNADLSEHISPHILINTFYIFRVDIKKLCLACSQKLTDKYSQALVDYRERSQFVYLQLFIAIGMVDLWKTVKSLPKLGCVYEKVFKPYSILGVCLN